MTLESLMKMLYKRAFDHVVTHINHSLSDGTVMESVQHIGILDIYGFEELRVRVGLKNCGYGWG